jgi:DNA modification methylase
MKLYADKEQYKLYHGSMLDMLEIIEPNTIDSIVTDPPYELNFMGKGWDRTGIAFQPRNLGKVF